MGSTDRREKETDRGGQNSIQQRLILAPLHRVEFVGNKIEDGKEEQIRPHKCVADKLDKKEGSQI